MPRKKKMNLKTQKYSKEDLGRAVTAVKNGEMNKKAASKFFNVPRSTLILKLQGWKNRKATPIDSKPGRKTALSMGEEENLSKIIATMNKWGFGMTRKEIINVVAVYVRQNKLETPFKDGIPGPDWFVGFANRWNLSCKKPSIREKVRVENTKPGIIYSFFDLYEETVKNLNLLDKPCQIFNLDETSLCHDPKQTKVVAKRGESVFRQTAGTGRANTSILFCVSADGGRLPPFIIYKGTNLWDIWMGDKAYPNTGYFATKNGWMTADAFVGWFQNLFLKQCPKERPLLIIFDGHTSHISPNLINLALKENITLLKLPPHTTHILQPLDTNVFRNLKVMWDQDLAKWQRENYGERLKRGDLSNLIGNVWSKFPECSIKRSFEICGLFDSKLDYPINRNAINPKIFHENDYNRYLQAKISSDISSGQKEKSSVEEEEIITIQIETTENRNITENIRDKTKLPMEPIEQKASFEELIITKLCRPSSSGTNKRKRVSKLAEVITREKYLETLEAEKENKIIREKNKNKTLSKKKKKYPYDKEEDKDETTDEDVQEIEYKDTSDDEQYTDYVNQLECEMEDPLEITENDLLNKWVIIPYTPKNFKNKTKYFVGLIINRNKNDSYVVKFIRKKGDKFVWPETEDIDREVVKEDIYRILPSPNIDRRGNIVFGIKFDGIDIC